MMFYGSAEGFREYHEERGREIPATWDNDKIDSALLVASEWLDSIYGDIWIGYPKDGFEQELMWPRKDATIFNIIPPYTFEDDVIPLRVINATYEAALREATTPGSLMIDFTPSKYKSVRVEGAIQVEYNSFFSSSEIQTQLTTVQSLMAPLINPESAGSFSLLTGRSVRV